MHKHRTFIFLAASLLAAFLVSPAVAQVRGIVPVPIKNPQGEQVLLYKESYALVVGVSEYEKGWPTLPGVLKDVELVKYALEEKDFHVITVINPSFDELRNAIEKFIHRYGQQEDNRLLFYFAGHGHTLKLSYGDEMGYFVPVDAPNPNRDESGFLAKSLNMESIEVFAKQIQAKHALFLFDSCFSGSIFALSRAIPANISYKTSEPVRQFITAGSANETVPDESIFRDQFIRAIRGEGDSDGDGYVTGIELGEFLQKTVVNYSKGSQHPQYGKIRNPNLDKGDFVFSLFKKERIEQSVDSIVEERKQLEQDRLKLEEKRKRVVALQLLNEEHRKLEEEKRRFKEAQDKLVRLQPPATTSGAPKGMVRIPGGEFIVNLDPNRLGANDLERGTWIVDTFYMDKYEVTQAEFENVMRDNPSVSKGENLPVEKVTWFEADEYCRKVGKRLPTEVEWEKASKGGRGTIFPLGDKFGDDKANFCDSKCQFDWKRKESDDGFASTAPVGSYAPNSYGLHDMAGNVWEWVADWYDGDYYKTTSRSNSKGPSSGKLKVLRGGSWIVNSRNLLSSPRRKGLPPSRYFDSGFRCAQ
ncbi:MAG TPA: hypothetical protein EYG65_09845 [Rhodospirillales bacterium]|nr:hypothetical protein [Rhodospirillales bacterium]